MSPTTDNACVGIAENELLVTPTNTETSSSLPCLTLERDETTRCSQLATKGDPKPVRCDIHDKQYRVLYKKYTVASKVVDDMERLAALPTREQFGQYTDWKAVRKYLKAIRAEKTGRDIHQRRFLLKADDSHRRGLELLEVEMARAVDTLEALQRRAHEIYQQQNGTLRVIDGPTTGEEDLGKWSQRTTEEVLRSICSPDTILHPILPIQTNKVLASPALLETGADDLIEIALRGQRDRMITILKPLTDFELFVDAFAESNFQPDMEPSKATLETLFLIYQQFARRILFHQPTLFIQSLETVSCKDLIFSDDFSIEDLARFLDPFLRPMEYPLMWLKDAIMDVLLLRNNLNAGTVDGRFPLLGGWIFNRSQTVSMTNEALWFLLKILRPPADVEHHFFRLCNSFEDVAGFFSFAAMGLVPSPGFCKSPSHIDVDDPGLSRNHLSLSGIIIADIVAMPRPPRAQGPVPTTRKATKPDCIVWYEHEIRTYMFGAMRNEPDAFTEAFLHELYIRPDLFQVVLRSETDPDGEIEMFGLRSGRNNNQAMPAVRTRYFEAPPEPSLLSASPSTRGKWEVVWSALDVLYGKSEERQGYLVDQERKPANRLFHSKTFPVTYFVILDTVPYRDRSVLARNVSWAALRAQGYAQGEYTLDKYVWASDALLERCARERLRFMPKDMEWRVSKMDDQIHSCSVM